jgi:hypothetical protein
VEVLPSPTAQTLSIRGDSNDEFYKGSLVALSVARCHQSCAIVLSTFTNVLAPSLDVWRRFGRPKHRGVVFVPV